MSRITTVRVKLQTNLLRANSNADGAYFGCCSRETVVTGASIRQVTGSFLYYAFTFPGFHIADIFLRFFISD